MRNVRPPGGWSDRVVLTEPLTHCIGPEIDFRDVTTVREYEGTSFNTGEQLKYRQKLEREARSVRTQKPAQFNKQVKRRDDIPGSLSSQWHT